MDKFENNELVERNQEPDLMLCARIDDDPFVVVLLFAEHFVLLIGNLLEKIATPRLLFALDAYWGISIFQVQPTNHI